LGWLEFISSMSSALGWPIIVLVIVLLMRREIAERLPFLQSVKTPGFEATFQADVAAVRSSAEALEEEVTRGEDREPTETGRRTDELEFFAQYSARGAILASFAQLERELNTAVSRIPTSERPRRREATAQAEALEKHGHLPEGAVRVIDEMRRLRNSAAHAVEFDIALESVANYIDAVEALASILKNNHA
jgi:hypothetical protein